MEFLLERAPWDSGRNHHRWSVPFPCPKPFRDPEEEASDLALLSRFCEAATQWGSGLPQGHCFPFVPLITQRADWVLFYLLSCHPPSLDSVGYMGKKCGCWWEKEQI